MRARAEFAVALLLQALGAAIVLLTATREWQTVTTARPRPFSADVLALSGRAIDGAPTALALVALAGVVAVLATKGVVRRVVGGLVALAGVALVWRCATAASAVGAGRAGELVRDKHPRVVQSSTVVPHVVTHPAWGALAVAGAVLVTAAGVAIAVRGGRWAAMSQRYERPATTDPEDGERARMRAAASLWSALERGDDPTARDPRHEH